MLITTKKAGAVFALLTSNNTVYSITNFAGEVLFATSVGVCKTKGLKKLVLSNVHLSILRLVQYIHKEKFTHLYVKIKGTNKTKKLFVKTLSSLDLEIFAFQDITSLPHNGCRKKRQKRI
uniref:Ribosomal protein S11 n=1 Tax=Paralemanea sp. TaxID=2048601 RepID=A0A343UY02_9FLOR|nr:ribosomal protein S11 [Paralemanea sp.]